MSRNCAHVQKYLVAQRNTGQARHFLNYSFLFNLFKKYLKNTEKIESNKYLFFTHHLLEINNINIT